MVSGWGIVSAAKRAELNIGREGLEMSKTRAGILWATTVLPAALSDRFEKTVWDEVVDADERYNDPGRSTAIIGYEWSAGISGDNLHRNVLFRGGVKDVAGDVPVSSKNSRDPEDLWTAFDVYERASVRPGFTRSGSPLPPSVPAVIAEKLTYTAGCTP
jgi:hypothetical protein